VWGEERVRVGELVGMGGVWCVWVVEWKVGSGVDGTGWGTGGMMGGRNEFRVPGWYFMAWYQIIEIFERYLI